MCCSSLARISESVSFAISQCRGVSGSAADHVDDLRRIIDHLLGCQVVQDTSRPDQLLRSRAIRRSPPGAALWSAAGSAKQKNTARVPGSDALAAEHSAAAVRPAAPPAGVVAQQLLILQLQASPPASLRPRSDG